MLGDITKSSPLSAYQPSQEVADFTAVVKEDYQTGDYILNKGWRELNDRSVIDDESRGQMMFNSFVDTSVEEPNEAWKWRGTRSMARNKGIAMHANLTMAYLLTTFVAQDESDDEDVGASQLMTDVVEWMAQPTNSDYQSAFLQMVFGMITNPVTFLGAEYCEVFQKIRQKKEDGTYEIKEILDEVFSGFQAPIYSSSQVLITNAYERNIQKQKRIWRRAWKDKSELQAKYGEHENFEYVTAGVKSIYNQETGAFYDIYDDEHPNLVAEEIVYDRINDIEIPFLNGICMAENYAEGQLENNPIKHRDNRDAPKYNVVPFGYMRIGEHFFYYKSQMNALGWDNMLYDAMSETLMNRAFLETEMPIAVSGTDKIDSEVIFPSAVVAFESPDTKVTPLLPSSNLNAGFAALRETEKSIDEGSISDVGAGQLPDKDQKVFNVAKAEANARKIIGAAAKSLAESVVKYGDLMKDIAINHITAPEVEELADGSLKLKYRSLILDNKDSRGKNVSKIIKFDPELIGSEMTEDERDYEELTMLEETGYPNNKKSLVRANPELWAKFKYLAKADVEEMFVKNSEYWQPILLALKERLAKDPFTDQEALTREVMKAFFRSRGDSFVKKAPNNMPGLPPGQMEKGGGRRQPLELPNEISTQQPSNSLR